MEVFSQRLKSARLRAGLSLKALSALTEGKLSHNAIHKYEQGKMQPDSENLLVLAKALGLKPGYFFRPVRYEVGQVCFRKSYKLGKKKEASIQEEVREKVERYLEIEEFLGIETTFHNPIRNAGINSPKDVEDLVETLLHVWDLGLNAIPNVIALLEDKEVKVLELEADGAFDGLSGWVNDSIPVIVLNRAFTMERKRFTALHELGHLLLDFREGMDRKAREKCCHRFAAAMLMPRPTFLQELGAHRQAVSMAELIAMKEKYGISVQAVMHRALDLGVISHSAFVAFRKRIAGNGEEKGLGAYPGKEGSVRFQQLVYRAVAEQVISIGKGAELAQQRVAEFRENYKHG